MLMYADPPDALPGAPDWARAALARAPERRFVGVNGAEIELLTWGEQGAPGLMLLHGHGAHADWWSFLAPILGEHFRVAAPSWSGMGNSQWRERYSFAQYAEEIMACAEAGGLMKAQTPPIVVGHSFGGIPLMVAVNLFGESIGGAVFVDCYVRPDNAPRPARAPKLDKEPRIYASVDDAVRRFKLSPEQPGILPWAREWIARRSVRAVEGGYVWKSDPNLRDKMERVAIAPHLSSARCPLAFVFGGASSLLTPPVRAHFAKLAPEAPWIGVPGAGHHLMLDEPLALVSALRGLFAAWPGVARRAAAVSI